MLLRPYVQKVSLVLQLQKITLSESDVHSPTVLHDMMVLLDPELASLPYDTEKKNISQEYAYQRLVELGQSIRCDGESIDFRF